MNLEYAAIIIIVVVAFIGIMSWMWEELSREERLEWSDKMRALGDAVKNIRTRKVK